MRHAVVLSLLLIAPALAGETWTLHREPEVGQRAEVVETSHSEVETSWKGRRAKVGGAEVKDVERRYVEEVRSTKPLRVHRRYTVSTRAKGKPGEDVEPTRTSLHGRSVLVQGLHVEPEEPFEVSKEDREALRFDRLVEALLPEGEVEEGDRWEVAPEVLGEALFARHVAPANLEGSGARVELRDVREEGGRQVAVLRVRALRVAIARAEGLPEIDLRLRGEVRWAVAEGAPVAARLEGPVRYVVHVGEGRYEAEGTHSWRYEATLVEPRMDASDAQREAGAPPPPGTRVLVCELDGGHRYPIQDAAFCLRCGERLDERRACPEHGFVLQRCPRDGSRLRPE